MLPRLLRSRARPCPRPSMMADTSELWVVATNALVRAVVLDGLTVYHPVVSAVIALLEPVVRRELAYYADETTWDEYPESDVPLRLLGDEVLMDATWAIVGDDALAPVLALLERCLDTAFDMPGRPASLTGRAAAEALIRAFPDHFECQAPGDEAWLQRLRATGRIHPTPCVTSCATSSSPRRMRCPSASPFSRRSRIWPARAPSRYWTSPRDAPTPGAGFSAPEAPRYVRALDPFEPYQERIPIALPPAGLGTAAPRHADRANRAARCSPGNAC